jgi:hypothetical protein
MSPARIFAGMNIPNAIATADWEGGSRLFPRQSVFQISHCPERIAKDLAGLAASVWPTTPHALRPALAAVLAARAGLRSDIELGNLDPQHWPAIDQQIHRLITAMAQRALGLF